MFKIVKELPFDKLETLYTEGNLSVQILRPSKLPPRFKDYDLKKNFQIWLREDQKNDKFRAFRPNHLRVLIDLNLRVRSRPDLKKALLTAFDNIFYGMDPKEAIKPLKNERFDHFLNLIEVTGNLSQLFLIEQEYCYHKESNFDPLTLFYQGWVREFIDSPKEIDNMCMSVSNRQPPWVKYTYKEDKNHKKYEKNRQSLWYLEND